MRVSGGGERDGEEREWRKSGERKERGGLLTAESLQQSCLPCKPMVGGEVGRERGGEGEVR